ncbi:MAG: arsenate reductase (glutaredoxin) [Pedobacter sp.]|nr:arsenate reductase (glutaredoxin) [Pedobacter sp.]MDQ8053410.1 arsenate reductase (glutaredoxin) [Pedobacter sp.]
MEKTSVIVYHNENCSKSCSALDVLNNEGLAFQVVEYLKDRPSIAELKEIVKKLNCRPKDIIRTNEAIYQEKFVDKDLSDEQWIEAMHNFPILIQRPIIVNGTQAYVARTPNEVIAAISKPKQ